MISVRVAPLARAINSRIFAPLLSARGALAFLAGAGLAALLPTLAAFFGAAVLVLAPLAVFWPLGAPFFWLAARRALRALFRDVGGCVRFCVGHFGFSVSFSAPVGA